MNGVRLQLARSAAGMSLRALEDRIDKLVTAQAIGKYERGEANPGSKVLLALSRALDVSVDYLLADDDLVLEDVEFRKKTGIGQKAKARVEATILTQLERYLAVEELLGLSSVDWDRPLAAPYPVGDVAGGDLAARSLRNAWGLGLDPIPNMVELLEERGVKVLTMDVDGIDGLTARVERRGHRAAPVVVVNPTHTAERQRFTLGHELAHLVMQVAPKQDEEAAAHRFAGAFLIPAEVLWAEVGKRGTAVSIGELAEAKGLFGVSAQALTHRCMDLGILGPTLHDSLFAEFKHRGWLAPPYNEPSSLSKETPKRFERLCLRALAEDAISESRAAELLAVSVHELGERMDMPTESVGALA